MRLLTHLNVLSLLVALVLLAAPLTGLAQLPAMGGHEAEKHMMGDPCPAAECPADATCPMVCATLPEGERQVVSVSASHGSAATQSPHTSIFRVLATPPPRLA